MIWVEVPKYQLSAVPPAQFPDAVDAGEAVRFPGDHMTCVKLASYGVLVDGPITRDYDWPGRFKPFKHQAFTADFLSKYPRAFCFNDLGTGKTLSVLWALDYLMTQGIIGSVIIVSTLSTLWVVWASEIFKSMPHRTYAVVHGSKKKRMDLLDKFHDFYIINHDGLKTLCKFEENRRGNLIVKETALDVCPHINHVVVDESAVFRNSRTDLYLALDAIAGPQAKTQRGLWLATGAPMPKAPTDIWAQARLVNPSLVPRYFTRFRDKVMFQVNDYNWEPRPGWEDYVFDLVRPCVRFKREQCLDLPPIIKETLECEMSDEQMSAYNSLKRQYVAELKDGIVTAANAGVRVSKMLQVACGVVYDNDHRTHELDCRKKLKLLDEAMVLAERKVIVFTPFKHSLSMLYDYISKKYSVTMLSGDVGASKRTAAFRAFQEGDLEVILAHPEVMAHGIDLTRGFVIVWWTPLMDFEIYEQANGRITRAGQTRTQMILHLVCSDAERKAYAALELKDRNQKKLLELLTTEA